MGMSKSKSVNNRATGLKQMQGSALFWPRDTRKARRELCRRLCLEVSRLGSSPRHSSAVVWTALTQPLLINTRLSEREEKKRKRCPLRAGFLSYETAPNTLDAP